MTSIRLQSYDITSYKQRHQMEKHRWCKGVSTPENLEKMSSIKEGDAFSKKVHIFLDFLYILHCLGLDSIAPLRPTILHCLGLDSIIPLKPTVLHCLSLDNILPPKTAILHCLVLDSISPLKLLSCTVWVWTTLPLKPTSLHCLY